MLSVRMSLGFPMRTRKSTRTKIRTEYHAPGESTGTKVKVFQLTDLEFVSFFKYKTLGKMK